MTRVADLTGAELALWVARAEGQEAEIRTYEMTYGTVFYCNLKDGNRPFAPHEDWAQGGPIIEKHSIGITFGAVGEHWFGLAHAPGNIGLRTMSTGPTPLIAAMRAFVASKFGEEVAS